MLTQRASTFFLAALFLATVSVTSAADKPAARPALAERALTPPMGWNSWDCFGTDVTETQVRATADYIAANMKKTGWEYVVIDMGWYFGKELNTLNFTTLKDPPQHLDEYGRYIPAERLYPSSAGGKGLKPIADYLHSKGLKLGIHIMRGIPWQAVEKKLPIKGTKYTAADVVSTENQCRWFNGVRPLDMTKPGAREYYQSIVDLYAEWGVDYIKLDDVGFPFYEKDIEAVGSAVTASERSMLLSLSVGPIATGNIATLRKHATMWRTNGDLWDDWSYLAKQFTICRTWQDYGIPGHWPDNDILPIGRMRINGTPKYVADHIGKRPEEMVNELSRLTADEQRTALTLWYIFRSPLMFGGSVLDLSEQTLQMLTNEEALAAHQQGTRGRELRATASESIWTSVDATTGDRYLALFNLRGDAPARISVAWTDLGIEVPTTVRDLWSKTDLGTVDKVFEATIPAHGAGLYRVTAPRKLPGKK